MYTMAMSIVFNGAELGPAQQDATWEAAAAGLISRRPCIETASKHRKVDEPQL